MEKIVRITHMGYMDIFDTLGGIAALEPARTKYGHNTAIGAGVAAAQKVVARGDSLERDRPSLRHDNGDVLSPRGHAGHGAFPSLTHPRC